MSLIFFHKIIINYNFIDKISNLIVLKYQQKIHYTKTEEVQI